VKAKIYFQAEKNMISLPYEIFENEDSIDNKRHGLRSTIHFKMSVMYVSEMCQIPTLAR